MKQDLITPELVRELFDYDSPTGILKWQKSLSFRAPVGTFAGAINRLGYVNVGINGHDYYAHRLIWLYVHGRWPAHQLDHVNGNRADNRLNNLREATNRQNGSNKTRPPRNNKSGVIGVHFDKQRQRWLVTVGHKFIGRFDSFDEAVAARTASAQKIFGEFFAS